MIILRLFRLLVLLHHDQILIFGAELSLAVVWDQVLILGDQGSSLLIVGIFRIAIDMSEGLWDDGNQKIQHHYISVQNAQDKQQPRRDRLDTIVKSVGLHVSQAQPETIQDGVGVALDELRFLLAALTQTKEGFSET